MGWTKAQNNVITVNEVTVQYSIKEDEVSVSIPTDGNAESCKLIISDVLTTGEKTTFDIAIAKLRDQALVECGFTQS